MREDLYPEMYLQEEQYWWHIAKRRLVIDFVPKIPRKILDVGCGTGMLMKELRQRGYFVCGIENNRLAIEFCKKRGLEEIKTCDLENNLTIDDNSFEVVTCLDVLEHIENDENLLKEFRRIIKPFGFLILTLPAYMYLWSYWDEMLGHKRRYDKGKLLEKLQEAGFQVVKISHFHSFLLPLVFVFRMLKSISKKRTSDFVEVPKFINKILLFVSFLERKMIRRTNLPLGLSFFVVAKKYLQKHFN